MADLPRNAKFAFLIFWRLFSRCLQTFSGIAIYTAGPRYILFPHERISHPKPCTTTCTQTSRKRRHIPRAVDFDDAVLLSAFRHSGNCFCLTDRRQTKIGRHRRRDKISPHGEDLDHHFCSFRLRFPRHLPADFCCGRHDRFQRNPEKTISMLQQAFESLVLRRVFAATVCLITAGGLYLLYARNPAVPGFFPPCPFLLLTGFYCPGCGALRTLHELMHFHFAHAFELNILVCVAVLPLGIYCARWLLSFSGLLHFPPHRIPKSAYYSVLIVILSFWLLRNLPWYPVSLLAPH